MFDFFSKKPKPVSSWSKYAPFHGIGARIFDEETNLFYSVSDAGERSLSACWESDPMIGASQATYDKLKAAFGSSMPPGSFIQIGAFMIPNIEPYVACYMDSKTMVSNPLLAELIRRKQELLLNAQTKPIVEQSGVLAMIRRIFVTVSVPVKGIESETDRSDVVEIVERVHAALRNAGLPVNRLGAKGYLAMMRMITHPFSKREDWYDETRSLNEQIFGPGDAYNVTSNHIEFYTGEQAWYGKALSVKYYPRKANLGLMNAMIGDPGGLVDQMTHPYWMVTTIHFPDRVAKKSAIENKFMAITHQTSVGNIANLVPLLKDKKSNFDILMEELATGGGSLCEINFTVWFYNTDLKRVKQQATSLSNYYATVGFDLRPDSFILDHLWKMCLPGGATAQGIDQTHRYHTMTTGQALCFLPLFGEWEGSGDTGVMMFFGRRGTPVLFDLWNAKSYNAVVFAMTGSGKSFFTQALITDYLAEGAKVWVIDVGYSYKKLASAMENDGEFLSFQDGSGVCLNPFTHVVNIDHDLDVIKAMLSKMAAPEHGLDDFHMSVLEEAIKGAYTKHGNSTTITNVAEWCLNMADARIRDIGRQLFPFTRNGSYGVWFEGKNNVQFSRDFVVLELEEIKNRPILQQVVLMQLMNRILMDVFLSFNKDGGRKKLLVIDESWALMDDPVMAKTIEGFFRKFRKYDGSVILISQNISDAYNSPNGRAIVQNAEWKFILEQKAESVDAAINSGHFSLDPYGLRMLKLVHTSPGRYSEIMIMGSGGSYGVVRLVQDQFTQVLYSTSGAARSEVLHAIENGQPAVKAIHEFLERENHRVR